MSHPFNEQYDNPEVVRVQNWAEIFKIVLLTLVATKIKNLKSYI